MKSVSWLKKALYSIAPYASVVIASLVVLVGVMRLWRADLHVPFAYSGDSLCVEMWIKGIMENGWYLHNHSLGLPGSFEMEDYPIADSLHFLLCKLISLAIHDHAVVFNIYFLVTFPLSALSAFWVLCHFGVSYRPSLIASLLFAFTPYHFIRGEYHLLLAAYYLIPLVVMLMLQICQGWNPWFRGRKETSAGPKGWMNGGLLLSLALCLLVGSSGVYYAFFSCFLILVAGIWSSFQQKTWAGLMVGGLFITGIVISVCANVLPSVLYHARHGANVDAVVRYPTEAETLALKINNLLLPMPGHRLEKHFHPAYTGGHDFGTNLGIVGGCGFVILIGRYLFGRYSTSSPQILDFLGILSISALLLATAGGFGYLFSLLITPWIRCYYRIAIFLAFFSLFAFALVFDKIGNRICRFRVGKLVYAGLCLVVLLGGIWDQTSKLWVFIPPYQAIKEEFQSDAEFVKRIEVLVPHQAIFQLPCVPFPELLVNHVFSSDLFRGYLHSTTLRWSSGAFKGRPVDYWQREVSRQPADKLAETVALAGFAGIYLDRNGFADAGASLESQLGRLLHCQPVVSSNQRLAFFDLTHYQQDLRERLGESEWQRKREAVLRPLDLSVSWSGGFSFMEGDPVNNWRWCSRRGELQILNSSNRAIEIVMEMSLCRAEGRQADLWIQGPGFSEHLEINGVPSFFKKRLNLPPGRHIIGFHADGERVTDKLVFRVNNFRMDWLSQDSEYGESAD
jgi:phosphoglycerol transferase